MLRTVHRAVAKSRPKGAGTRSYHSATLCIPGVLSDQQVEGLPVSELIVPRLNLAPEVRQDALWTLFPYLTQADATSRSEVKAVIGRQAMGYTMAPRQAEVRLVRLLWIMGQGQVTDYGPDRLLIDIGGWFGYDAGKLVGGPFNGVPMPLPVEEFLVKEFVVTTRSQRMVEIRRVLESRHDPDVYQYFRVLYAMAEWDIMIPLDSVLLPKPRRSTKTLAAISKTLFESKDPYRYLYKALVPIYMTYSDFIALFGNPSKRGNLGQQARINLVNKVHLLPFFE